MPGEPNDMESGEDCVSLAIDCIYGFDGVGKYWADSGCAPGMPHAMFLPYNLHVSCSCSCISHASPMNLPCLSY